MSYLGLKLFSARFRQRVELRLSPGFAVFPLRIEPAAIFQPVQCGVERTLMDLEKILGDLLEALRDAVAVPRAERKNLQDEEVQSPLEELRFCVRRSHT